MTSTQGYALLCLENPLLDIQAQGNEALLQKYGLKANDAILAEDKHKPIYEDLLTNYSAKLIAGGAAQNTARGAQYILPPHSTLFIGCVGKDKYADILHKACDDAGLHVEYLEDAEVPTGRCGVVITGQERSMCTDLAAANLYKESHLKSDKIWRLVKAAKIFALSLSAPFIPQFFKSQLDETAPYWDYIIGNETEALSYAESHSLDTKDISAITKHLANLPKKNTARKRVAIITQGTQPTLVAVQGEDSVKSYKVREISASEINDTNGAGDAFAGGFMAGVVEGKPLDVCVDMGHWLASLSIRELGPSYPFPKKTYHPQAAPS
ncbi:MAG: adenosine kinase [Vezdaea acicularis]|nr:MAG: adenosine kinase [Vezdaea acicularis]